MQTWTRIRASWLAKKCKPKHATRYVTLRIQQESQIHKRQIISLLSCWARAADSHTLKTIIKMLITLHCNCSLHYAVSFLFRLCHSTSPSPLANSATATGNQPFESRPTAHELDDSQSRIFAREATPCALYWRNRKGQQRRSQYAYLSEFVHLTNLNLLLSNNTFLHFNSVVPHFSICHAIIHATLSSLVPCLKTKYSRLPRVCVKSGLEPERHVASVNMFISHFD